MVWSATGRATSAAAASLATKCRIYPSVPSASRNAQACAAPLLTPEPYPNPLAPPPVDPGQPHVRGLLLLRRLRAPHLGLHQPGRLHMHALRRYTQGAGRAHIQGGQGPGKGPGTRGRGSMYVLVVVRWLWTAARSLGADSCWSGRVTGHPLYDHMAGRTKRCRSGPEGPPAAVDRNPVETSFEGTSVA